MKKTVISLLVCGLLCGKALFADVVVESPYVRAMPPGQTVTGAFMLVKNTGDQDRAIISANSDAANVVELHTHKMEDGMMKMRQIPQIGVSAQSSTELKPGGLHIMLIDVPNPLQAGDLVRITLNLDDGSDLQIEAPVKTVTGGMKMDGKHAHGESAKTESMPQHQ